MRQVSSIKSHFCNIFLLQYCNAFAIIQARKEKLEAFMTVGERIKQRRKQLFITADQLAKGIGCSRATIFRYENGSIENLNIKHLVPLARELHTTVGWLMGWENSQEESSGAVDNLTVATQYLESFSEQKMAEALNYLRYLSSIEEKK
jgi:transcriptional regulator with XRE-family HTH domain